MNILEHAKNELALIGADPASPGYKHIMELANVVFEQGHENPNGYRSMIAMFYRIANFETLSPLTGEDEEWNQVSPVLWQNLRCSSVYRETGVGPYDANGIIFIDENDNQFTRQPQSRVPVRFPYDPRSKYVRVKTNRIVVPDGVRTKQ